MIPFISSFIELLLCIFYVTNAKWGYKCFIHFLTSRSAERSRQKDCLNKCPGDIVYIGETSKLTWSQVSLSWRSDRICQENEGRVLKAEVTV